MAAWVSGSSQVMSSILQANGYDFHYLEAGSGQPLVFVHGSLLDWRYWRAEVAHFAANFRAIALSRRHHWPILPKGDFSYTGAEQTEDVIAFLEELGGGSGAPGRAFLWRLHRRAHRLLAPGSALISHAHGTRWPY